MTTFLFSALADGAARPLATLAELAISQGHDFGMKNPKRVLHFALVGLKSGGYTEMVGDKTSVWRLTKKALPAESPSAPDGNGGNGIKE